MSYHIHFGAGKLGLGFVIPIINNLGVGIAVFQRPGSSEWTKLSRNEDVKLLVNSEHILSMKNVTDSMPFEELENLTKSRNHLLVSTYRVDLLRAILKHVTSFSTSTGSAGFMDVIEGIGLYDNYHPEIKLFAFENDFDAVEKFSKDVQTKVKHMVVVPVMCDRICTQRVISAENNSIIVTAEDFTGIAVVFQSSLLNCYPFTTPGSHRRKCTPNSIVLANSKEKGEYYYQRKFSLLNGIHFTMSVFAYVQMNLEKITQSTWFDQPLSYWKKNPSNEQNLQLLIQIRIIKLIQTTDLSTLQSIFNTSHKCKIYQEIKNYSKVIMDRISQTKDVVGRILNFNDSARIKTKYSQHFLQLYNFFMKNTDQIKQLHFLENNIETYKASLDSLNKDIITIADLFGCQFMKQ